MVRPITRIRGLITRAVMSLVRDEIERIAERIVDDKIAASQAQEIREYHTKVRYSMVGRVDKGY